MTFDKKKSFVERKMSTDIKCRAIKYWHGKMLVENGTDNGCKHNRFIAKATRAKKIVIFVLLNGRIFFSSSIFWAALSLGYLRTMAWLLHEGINLRTMSSFGEFLVTNLHVFAAKLWSWQKNLQVMPILTQIDLILL